jgi:hypothetical protein
MARKMDTEKESLIDIEAAAEVSGYSVGTLRKYAQRRIVPFYQSGPGMPLYFKESELLEWKRRRTEPKQVVPLDPAA